MNVHGLKKEFIHTTGISLTRLSTSKEASTAEEIREGTAFIASDSQDEQLRNRFETNLLLGFVKKSINFLLTLSGKGDALKGLFIKS